MNGKFKLSSKQSLIVLDVQYTEVFVHYNTPDYAIKRDQDL